MLPVTVSCDDNGVRQVVLDQTAPKVIAELKEFDELAAALGLDPSELGSGGLPSQVVSTGTAHLMVPMGLRDSIDRIQVERKALSGLLSAIGAQGCYAFSLDPRHPEAVAYARFFNPTMGLWEDPATGTAAGSLAGLLVSNGIARENDAVVVEQGTAMGRTSLVESVVSASKVTISGRCVVVASGNLHL